MRRMFPLVFSVASAQSLSAVPPGATAVTVMTCDRADGCVGAYAAFREHCAELGIPLLDFDDVAPAGLGGGDARAKFDALRAAAVKKPDLAHYEGVRTALRSTPLTLPADDVFTLWLRLADLRLAAGDRSGADNAFAAAASSSGARVYDLPDLSPAALDRYLQLAHASEPPGTLDVSADVDGVSIFVDGRLAGPAPLHVEVPAGWHRVTGERPGRRTAWVAEVGVGSRETTHLGAELAADDAGPAMETAVLAAIRGDAPPPDVAERLATWAKAQGLVTVRFVEVTKPGQGSGTPEEVIEGRDHAWDVHATWLDVPRRRFDAHGAGPAALRSAANPDRFAVGLGFGYERLQGTQTTGPDPHDHITTELTIVAELVPQLALDARVGLWGSAQAYYLYTDWLSHEVVPIQAGLRVTFPGSGAYLGAHGMAVVPMAFGGDAFVGWAWHPSPRWRVGLEGNGGYLDRGPIFGGGLFAAFSG